MKRIIALLAALTLLIGAGAAQQQQTEGLVNTVIVTSVNNTPDTLIATGPARKLGIPILHTTENSLPEPTRNSLQMLQPENIVILGGPQAINPELESELGNYSNSTTRLWGTTATETSIKTSEYYWPEGSRRAAIIHTSEGNPQQLSKFASLIQELEAGKPVLISEGENISASVLGEIQRLNAEQVTIYGATEQQVNTSQLTNLTNQVEVRQGTAEEINQIKNRQASAIVNNIGVNDTLVLAAGQENGQIAAIPYLMDMYVFGIPDEAQIDTAVGLVSQVQTDQLWVTGGPELVNDVTTVVEDVTGKELRVIEGTQLEIINRIIQRRLSSVVVAQEALYQPWMDHVQNSTQLQISTETQMEEARNIVDQNAPQQAQQKLQQAEQSYQQNNWFEARKLALQATSQTRIQNYMQQTGSPGNQTGNGILS